MAGSEKSVLSPTSRPDLNLVGNPYFEKLEGKWIVKQMSSAVRIAGKCRLNFPGPDQFIKNFTTLERLRRASGGAFAVANAGHDGYYDVNPSDVGLSEPIDRSDGYISSLIQSGAPIAEIERVKTEMSVQHFAESLEVLGSAKLVAATTPFGTTTFPLADVSLAAAKWDDVAASTDKVLKQFDVARETCYWGSLNCLIASEKAVNALRRHPDLTGLFGGTSGLGRLTHEQLLEALELDYVFAGLDSRYGNTAILCQQYPRAQYGSPYDGSTVMYCVDPQDAGREYGLQYSEEAVAGSHGKAKTILVHANCDVAINPYTGIRWTNVKT